MSGSEFTFAVHPRPASDDPKAVIWTPQPTLPSGTPPLPVVDDRKWDTLSDNLHFLWRYAFGRY